MSSIINALKKLEEEISEKEEVRPWPLKSPAKKSIHQRLKGSRLFNKRFFLVLAVVIIAVGGWLILSRKPWQKAPVWVAKTEIKPAKPSSLPEKPEKKVSLSDMPQKETPTNKDLIKSEPISNTAKTTPISARKHRERLPVPVAGTEEIKPTKPADLPGKMASTQRLPPKETPTEKAANKSEQNTAVERFASISLKHSGESGLQLQAIAWAGDSKNRMAVINGRIIREKESVDGVLVTHIGKGYVIFEKGTEEWRQLFR